jgi:2-polyprenyl-6-methoxyphenol hydroxylase-like FAD-dependent oxidoreductase
MAHIGAPRALVIGGSLAGLFTATTLRSVGWDVQVFERSPHDLDSRGGGIVLQPDVLSAFRFAGIPYAQALGVRSGDRIYLDRDGQVIQRMYMPQTQTSWNMLYSVMRRSLPEGLVHQGEELIRFEQESGQVLAHFASGRVVSGDLLVGADGPRSCCLI